MVGFNLERKMRVVFPFYVIRTMRTVESNGGDHISLAIQMTV